jgi:alpha-beta hydrolase superfamily lysophospholipase
MGLAHRLAKKVFFGRFQKPWRWPEEIAPNDWERVWFLSGNGARLAAVFGAARGERALGAVVLAHPMSAAAKAFWMKVGHADVLRYRGFHVLAFDFNGFGESESADFDYPGDVLAAGRYLRDRVAPLPIAVLGCSFGAGHAMNALSRRGHPFRAAVLEATFPSLPFYWRPYPLPYFLLRFSQIVYPPFERALRPIAAAAALEASPHILLIHGDADTVTPPHVGDDLRAAMSGHASVDVWRVPGAEHNQALRMQREEYGRRVGEFLTRALA